MSARISKAAPGTIRNMKLLIKDDFTGEELSVANAREAFSDLLNIDHITEVIDKFEGLVTTALEENRKPSDEIANMVILILIMILILILILMLILILTLISIAHAFLRTTRYRKDNMRTAICNNDVSTGCTAYEKI